MAGCGLGLASVVVAVLAEGGRVSPRLDLLAHLAPFWLVGAILAGLLSLAGYGLVRRAGLLLALMGVIAAGSLIAPEFLRDAGPTAQPGAPGEIKVIQFNVWRSNQEKEAIARWLVAENPDFVLLEEANPFLRDRIMRLTGWNIAGEMGTTYIFSRKHYLVMNRPMPPGQPVTFVNATYESSSGPVEVMVTHITRPTRPQNAGQADSLAFVTAALPRRRMILAGDFNAAPWSFDQRRIDSKIGLIRRDRALATWPTGHSGDWRWPAPFPFLPIDHVYAGPGWATTSVRRGPRLGSGHYPVVVTLAPVDDGR